MKILGHNHKIKNFIVSKIWLVKSINFWFNLKNRKGFDRLVEERKNTDLFNYRKIADFLPYAPDEIVIDNNLYGIAYWLKKYAGIKRNKSLSAYIEHGVYFGSIVREDQKKIPVKSIITYSNVRENHLKKSSINKNILKIGPFIHYVDSLLSKDEINTIKQQLGKTLLVFPSHGIIGVESRFDKNSFFDEIEKVSKNFDTILISMYWIDIQKGNLIDEYEKRGFEIVTSGHRFDFNFLARQRTLIELSDYTMSNSVGTHVGYCVYLNKPHYVFSQEVSYVGDNPAVQKHFDQVRNPEQFLTLQEEKKEIATLFSSFTMDFVITDKQREIVDKYWGCQFIRSPQELTEMLKPYL